VGLYLLRWKKLFSPAFFHGWGLVLGILSRPDHAPRYKKTHPKTGAFLVILKSKIYFDLCTLTGGGGGHSGRKVTTMKRITKVLDPKK